MRSALSVSSQSNPSSSSAAMNSSNSPQTPIPQTPDPPSDSKKTETAEKLEEKIAEDSIKEGDGDGEEEEEGECGFCLFMKGGGCKETFVEWEKCVEEGEKKEEDIVEKCFQATSALKKCMEAHSNYYAPLLQAEKAAEEEAVKQLEEEKEKDKLNNLELGNKVEASEKKEKS